MYKIEYEITMRKQAFLGFFILLSFLLSGCDDDWLKNRVNETISGKTVHFTYRNDSTYPMELVWDHFGDYYAATLNPGDSVSIHLVDPSYRYHSMFMSDNMYEYFEWIKIRVNHRFVRRWQYPPTLFYPPKDDAEGKKYLCFSIENTSDIPIFPEISSLCRFLAPTISGNDWYMPTFRISDDYYHDAVFHELLRGFLSWHDFTDSFYVQKEDGMFYLKDNYESCVQEWAESLPQYQERMKTLNEEFEEEYASAIKLNEPL